MRRREFIAILGNAVASSFAAQAQPAAAGEKLWRIGLLSNGPPPQGRGIAYELRGIARLVKSDS
jgi:hypothetical protein